MRDIQSIIDVGRQIINNVLSNENYLGNSDYPQLIIEDLWNAVQKKKNNSGRLFNAIYPKQIDSLDICA